MEALSLKKENTGENKHFMRLPYFIEIVRNERKLRIPCVNEEIAKKVLLGSKIQQQTVSKE